MTEPDEIVKDETEDSEPAEDQDFGSDDEELTNDSDAADSADAEEVTEENNELDLSDVPEMVMEGEAVQDYLIQLYSSGKLVKSYAVSNSASAAAKRSCSTEKKRLHIQRMEHKSRWKRNCIQTGSIHQQASAGKQYGSAAPERGISGQQCELVRFSR